MNISRAVRYIQEKNLVVTGSWDKTVSYHKIHINIIVVKRIIPGKTLGHATAESNRYHTANRTCICHGC